VERQNAVRAEVRIVADWPQRRRTPVSGLQTQEIVSLIGIAAANGTRARRLVGVEATGINACPCAQDMVRGSAAERLAEAGFGDDADRILDLVPLATHNQRGRGTLLVGTAHELDAEDLALIVERSMSAPVYELLKRPDELHVVEQAHRNPRFVEDSVRIAIEELLASTPELEDGDFVLARQRNLETIHDHDVLAERWGTVGEIRRELDGSAAAPDQTTLEAWLRS
jgi:GTP cyclohydrolase-4